MCQKCFLSADAVPFDVIREDTAVLDADENVWLILSEKIQHHCSKMELTV